MDAPAISVLLPVYNAEAFLTSAIESILAQTFTNFELLCINDGSLDGSEEIIKRFTDPRVVYIKNAQNEGLISTLNKGIDVAKGMYIARMDADDVCVPERLQKQFNWLETHPGTAVVGSHISLIDEHGLQTGEWKEDIQTVTYQQVKKTMAWYNCVAHPTVLMRSAIIKKYRYQSNQKHTEDYDLWLRLLADGHTIEKVPEKLLLYRVHQKSVTGSILRRTNPFLKQYNCKRRFLVQRVQARKWGAFETRVLLTMLHNGAMGIGKHMKQRLHG